MSSIMNDIDKIQVATSHMLADWLRQFFTVIGLLFVVLQKDWKLALVSLTVLPFVLVPTIRIGRRIRRTTRRTQDNAAELNQILQETISGHQVVKSFGAEEIESNRFRAAAARLQSAATCATSLQQAISSPLIEFFGAITIVGLLTYARTADQAQRHDHRRIHQLRHRAADAVRAREAADRHPQHLPAGARRIAEGLRIPRSRLRRSREKPNAVKLDGFSNAIVFDNVSFRYPSCPERLLARTASTSKSRRARWWRWWARAAPARPPSPIWCRASTT